mgnify:CR=1 FL=1
MHQKLPGMSWLFCSRGHIHKKSSLCPCVFVFGDIYAKSFSLCPCVFVLGDIYTKKSSPRPSRLICEDIYAKSFSLCPLLFNRTFPATFLLYVPLAFPRGTFPTTFLPYVPPTPPPTKHCHNLSSICVLQPAQPHSLLVRIMIPYAIEHFPVRPG